MFEKIELLPKDEIPISEYKRFHIAIHGMYDWGDGFKDQEAINTYDLFWVDLCCFGVEHKLHSEISDLGSRLLKADRYGFDKTDIFVHPMELVGYATEEFIQEITDFINQNKLCIERGISADANVIRDVSSLSDKEYRELLISHSKEIVEAVKNEIVNYQPKDVYNFVKSGFGMDFAREARIDRIGDKSGISANDTDVMVVNNIIDTALALGAFNKEIASQERQIRREIELQQKMQAQMDPTNMINSPRAEVRCEAARRGYGLDKLVNDNTRKVRVAVAEQGYGLDKLINDKYSEVRIAVAEQGYGLDKLVEDRNFRVRIALAKQGYGLDKLVNDEKYRVREEVAKQGYGLDKLINDEDCRVRATVAEQGFGLDKLVDDEDWEVRKAVAGQGYGLDKLVNDEYCEVRVAVAEQGYALDILINDKRAIVREAVAKQGYGLDKLVNDEDCHVRTAVAEQGYGLDKLVNDEVWHVRDATEEYLKDNKYKNISEWKKDNSDKVYYKAMAEFRPYGTDEELDKLVDNEDWKIRQKAAYQGYGLDKLIDDKYGDVREEVAKQGYGLDKLVNDEFWAVRCEVAKQGYGLDKLVDDKIWEVRRIVARQGYGLDKLVNDEFWDVRCEVVKQGYGLDKLINDKDRDIRKAVKGYLEENKYKDLQEWKKDNPDKTYYKNNKSRGQEKE